MLIGEIVRVTITRGTKSVSRAGFGTPLILTSEAAFTPDLVKTYTSISGVADDFLTSTAAYKMAQKLFGQERKPKQIKIGKRTAMVAQVNTLTPNVSVQSAQSFIVTINGVAFDFVSDATPTAAEVVTGLIALINAGSEPVTASGTTTLILTADVAGTGFSISSSANMANVATTANNGIVEDLNNIIEVDNDFYCVLTTDKSDGEILNLAAAIEALRKIFIVSKNTAGILESGSSDLGSQLKALSYTRTALLWSADFANGPEGAWAGGVLPLDPGSETWKFKTLVGITADKLTASQEAQAKLKKVNIYTTIAGVGIVSEGYMAVGEFIDTIRFIDWLQAQIEEAVFSMLVSVPKVPFTDKGIASVELQITKCLQRGVAAGGLSEDPAPYTEVPKAADVAALDRADRLLPDMKFGGTLAGAIHFVEIEGVLSI